MTISPHHPLFHFAPADAWMNDPNGLVRHDGRWHMFYQRSETPPEHRVIGWGHAVSDDLVGWMDLGMAIPPNERGYAYSGSVVADPARPQRLVALFTRHNPVTGVQSQERAVSDDGALTWRCEPEGPVLDEGLAAFRDPFPVRVADGSWRMLTVKPIAWHDWRSGRSRIAVHRSDDLRQWHPVGDLGPQGEEGEIYEVPVLLRLRVPGTMDDWRWLLIVSIVDRSGDTVACRTTGRLGRFDGRSFVTERGPFLLDHGPDYYAATAFAGLPEGEAVTVAWIGSWAYARRTPAGFPTGGVQSLPRLLSLALEPDGRIRLVQKPALDPVESARRSLRFESRLPDGSNVPWPVRSTSFIADLDVDFGGAERVEVALLEGGGTGTLLHLDRKTRTVVLDRTRSDAVDFDPALRGQWRAPLTLEGRTARLRIAVDRCTVEILPPDGGTPLTALVFPADAQDAMSARAIGGEARLTGSLSMFDQDGELSRA